MWNFYQLAKTLYAVELKNVEPYLNFMSDFGKDIINIFMNSKAFDYNVYLIKCEFIKCVETMVLCMNDEEKKCL